MKGGSTKAKWDVQRNMYLHWVEKSRGFHWCVCVGIED